MIPKMNKWFYENVYSTWHEVIDVGYRMMISPFFVNNVMSEWAVPR